MDTCAIAELFPDLYRKFLPDFFNTLVPVETSATCDDCAMLPEPEQANDEDTGCFSAASKCCTYHPGLPNYLVGSILSSRDAAHKEARKRLAEKIVQGVSVTPFGLEQPKKFMLMAKSSEGLFFGHSTGLICPYFDKDGGKCLLWPHLSVVCRTWFCKYDRGKDGMRFWHSLKSYWQYLEKALSVHALQHLGFSPEEILKPMTLQVRLTAEDIDDRPPHPKYYKAIWGKWVGREVEFYKKAFAIIADLKTTGLEKLGGIYHNLLLEDVRRKYNDMMKMALPEKMKRNPKMILNRTKRGNIQAVGYSLFDSVELTPRIYDVLDYYDGSLSNEDVAGKLLADGKAVPDEALLLSLYHMRILVAPDE